MSDNSLCPFCQYKDGQITRLRLDVQYYKEIAKAACKETLITTASALEALAFAKSCIKNKEDWSPTCDEIIDGTLESIRGTKTKLEVGDG